MILPVSTVLPGIFAVGIIAFKMSPFFYKIFGSFEIFLFVGDSIQFHQSHFNNLMARRNMFFIMTEDAAHQVGIFQSNIQQISFSCRLIVGSGSLIQMTGVVQLMT